MTNNGPLAAAEGLRDLIVGNRGETESLRLLPGPIIDALVHTKLCRMALPVAEGGLETSPVDALPVFESLAAAEASVAWFVWNNSLTCWFARFMPPETRRKLFRDPTAMFANSTRPSGRAVENGNGYKLNGRWSLVSGCVHAAWIPVAGLVEENGEIQMLGPGMPHMRMFIVPREAFEILDTWHVGGLRGTGSHDVILKDADVPAGLSFSFTDSHGLNSPLARMPIIATMACGCASICLGITRAAMDALLDLGRAKQPVDPGPGLRDRPQIQTMLARRSSTIEALRADLVARLSQLWSQAAGGKPRTVQDLASAWAAAITTALECRAALTDVYAAAGASALYVDNPIERAHRDIHAVTQHIALQPFWLEQAGRVKFGLDPNHPLFAL